MKKENLQKWFAVRDTLPQIYIPYYYDKESGIQEPGTWAYSSEEAAKEEIKVKPQGKIYAISVLDLETAKLLWEKN